MTVVYLDGVFLLNVLLDYLLLLVTGRLAGIPLRRGRYLLSAVLGGSYAACTFLPGGEWLAGIPGVLAVWAAMALGAFWGDEKLPRLALLWLLLSCGLAGAILAVASYTGIGLLMLLVSSVTASLLVGAVFRGAAGHGIRGNLIPVRLCSDGTVVELTALFDSGNRLSDPETGRPVLVVTRSAVRYCPVKAPRPLPYCSVGAEGKALCSFLVDRAEIGGIQYEDLRIAVSPTELGNGYTALWGGTTRRRRNGEMLGMDPENTDPMGTAGSAGDLVHRGQ